MVNMDSNKYKVLIFGHKTFGGISPEISNVDYCEVDRILFPNEFDKLSHLYEYDLVILSYSAFATQSNVFTKEQDIFDKGMLEALKNGTCFCFLHYNEEVPAHNKYNHEKGYMDNNGINSCYNKQIGFRWLYRENIRPWNDNNTIIDSKILRSEFKVYKEHWGASKNSFEPYNGSQIDDILFSLPDDFTLGFSISVERGKILYIPCQVNDEVNSVEKCLKTLINNIVTYLTRSSKRVPLWANKPLFPKEKDISSELEGLKAEMDELSAKLAKYESAKEIMFLSEYDFEDKLPKFLKSYLGISTLRNEQYKEDFWILDSNSEKIVIGETKTYVRGFKKSGIYALYNHRESNDLEEDFPALLVVNAHLNAKSLNDKTKPINPQEYEVAAKNNILILRIEDLLFYWYHESQNKYGENELLFKILNERGWMEVKSDGQIIIHN